MRQINLDLPTPQEAEEFGKALAGEPTTNRVLVATLGDDNTTKSGIILVKGEDNSLPKIGVIVKVGPIDEEYKPLQRMLKVGRKIHYGIYGGKVVEPDVLEGSNLSVEACMKLKTGKYQFSVLSANEILYVE